MPSVQSNDAAHLPSDSAIDTGADPELAAERAHLEAARVALDHMHADVAETETPAIVNAGSDSYWDNKFYQWTREHRAEVLLDQPMIPLFFGRLDCEPGAVFDQAERGSGFGSDGEVDRIYIGRRHVRKPDGTPLVIDWRAPVAVPFYRAGPADPQRVLVRRRHGFSSEPGPSGHVEVTAYEDELVSGAPVAATEGFSNLVTAEIERPRSGPMRDIVATIQPDQDVLVRAPLDTTICVQGAPGTGKTAVGLHRVAYLLYAERNRLARDGGVAIVGPNQAFLAYIRHVLPALGEVFVQQLTFSDLIRRYFPDHAMAAEAGSAATVTVKGDARMAAVLRRALWSGTGVDDDVEALVYSMGASRFRVPNYQVRDDRRGRTPDRHSLCHRPHHGCAAARPRGAGSDGGARRNPGRSDPERGGQVGSGEANPQPGLAAAHRGTGAVPAAVRCRLPRRRGRRRAHGAGARSPAVAKALPLAEICPLVRGRPGTAGRACRAAREYAPPGPPGSRRGAGLLRHAAPRARSALSYRDRVGRPGSGHHAVRLDVVADRAGPTGSR